MFVCYGKILQFATTFENVHGAVKKTLASIKPSKRVKHMGDGLPRHKLRVEPEDGLYSEEEFQETMDTLHARFPTMNFDAINRSEIHTPFRSYNCRTIQFRKVDVLHASNTQCSRVY